SNGNFFFDSGRQGKPPWFAQSIEVLPDGTKTYVLQDAGPEFHSYRMRTLYEGINDQLADDDGTRRTGTSRAGSDPASINSGPDTGSAGLSADDMNAAAARASIASSRLATPPTLPASLPSVLSEALAPDSIDVLLLDGGKVTTNGGITPTDGAARDLLFAQLDLDWSAWDALTGTFNEW